MPSFRGHKEFICKRKKNAYIGKTFIKTFPAINVIVIRELMTLLLFIIPQSLSLGN